MSEVPVRVPPPLSMSKIVDGIVVPIPEKPFFECGQTPVINGRSVVCIRRKGHPVRMNYGHTNGFIEWAFDVPEGGPHGLLHNS